MRFPVAIFKPTTKNTFIICEFLYHFHKLFQLFILILICLYVVDEGKHMYCLTNSCNKSRHYYFFPSSAVFIFFASHLNEHKVFHFWNSPVKAATTFFSYYSVSGGYILRADSFLHMHSSSTKSIISFTLFCINSRVGQM